MRGRPRKNDIPSEDIELVAELYADGLSLKDLARQFNVTSYVVREALTGQGVEIRRRGRVDGFKPKKKPKEETTLFDEHPDTEPDPFKETKPVDHSVLTRPLGSKENS